ncbi:MAG: type II secretion system GspH family protein [Desulfobacterota bacterium]|nr:type II secretion system GspH family protein [Thermodesulfobacteriota bacterium]
MCQKVKSNNSNGKTMAISPKRQGFTLIEIMVALLTLVIVIMGFWMVMPTEKSVVDKTKDKRVALLLAKQMMEEVQTKAYEDPDLSPNSFGREEEPPRTHFDDIDDYNGWSETPPQYPDGTILNGDNGKPDYRGFCREVRVENVDDNNYGNPRANGTTNSKKVTVRVLSVMVPKAFADNEIILQWVANREGMKLL